MKKIIKSWCESQFSKKLAIIIVVLYISSYVFMNITQLLWNIDTTILFNFLQTPFSVVLAFYFSKSLVENVTKISTYNKNKSEGDNK